jgi:hypothetical protein
VDWKPFYGEELESAAGRRAVAAALRGLREAEPALVDTLRNGGVLSFPHTSVHASARPMARVLAALFAARPERILALGVLHGGALPEPFQGLHEDYASWLGGRAVPGPRVEQAFAELGGGFFSPAPLRTSHGQVALAGLPQESAVLRQRSALLAHEFSLDIFLALLAEAPRALGADPIPVLPLYVLLTRDPRGSFATARRLAGELRAWAGGRAAIVATGDLVHHGNAYSTVEEMAGLPVEVGALTGHFRAAVDTALAAALARREYEAFYRASLGALKNDQRNLVPVIAELLGPGAAHEIVSFTLTDYSAIRGVAPPCVVASALVRYFSTSRQFS